MNDLIANIDKLHTTELGSKRVKRNLGLSAEDIVTWCKHSILSPDCSIKREGKNWYARTGDCEITVNAHSYTIITGHRIKS